jgi:uncharacterized protein
MLLSVKEMEVRKLLFAESWPPGEIDFSDSGVRQAGALKTEGEAELIEEAGNEIRVKGRVEATLETECDRCLGPARFPIDARFDLFYRPVESMDEAEDEAAIDEGEAEMGFYRLPGLVLEDILKEQVLLQLPMQRVCGKSCKGICPICGANRNETECRCEPNPGDDRWNALKELHFQKDTK